LFRDRKIGICYRKKKYFENGIDLEGGEKVLTLNEN